MKTPDLLTESELRKAIAKVAVESSTICSAFIDAGRGFERPSETRLKSDPLSVKWQDCAQKGDTLRAEENRRRAWHGSLKRIIARH